MNDYGAPGKFCVVMTYCCNLQIVFFLSLHKVVCREDLSSLLYVGHLLHIASFMLGRKRSSDFGRGGGGSFSDDGGFRKRQRFDDDSAGGGGSKNATLRVLIRNTDAGGIIGKVIIAVVWQTSISYFVNFTPRVVKISNG